MWRRSYGEYPVVHSRSLLATVLAILLSNASFMPILARARRVYRDHYSVCNVCLRLLARICACLCQQHKEFPHQIHPFRHGCPPSHCSNYGQVKNLLTPTQQPFYTRCIRAFRIIRQLSYCCIARRDQRKRHPRARLRAQADPCDIVRVPVRGERARWTMRSSVHGVVSRVEGVRVWKSLWLASRNRPHYKL
jgi:hypothetical protein